MATLDMSTPPDPERDVREVPLSADERDLLAVALDHYLGGVDSEEWGEMGETMLAGKLS